MKASPRFWPKRTGGALAEITARTIGARALLTPGPDPRTFNEIVVGVMGRALEVSPLEVCACVWASNHYHLLVVAHEQQELSRFMQHLACNISKEVGRLRDWTGALWARRYDAIVVSDEPEVQRHRLKYLLAQGYASYCTSFLVH
ncbi:MAG TPA: transposase [Thermoanaerobaculia bacterium]